MSVAQSKIVLLNLLELCAAVFHGPDEYGWAELTTHGLPELPGRVQDFPVIPAGPLAALDEALAPHAAASDFSALEAEYVRLFIAGPGGVPAPLYQSCHLGGGSRTMGESARAMRDRLAEEGLEVALDSNEPPDHLALELEYLFHLCAGDWSGDAAEAERGARFAGEVMLPWVRRFRDALAGADPDPVYLAAADVAVALLEAVAEA